MIYITLLTIMAYFIFKKEQREKRRTRRSLCRRVNTENDEMLYWMEINVYLNRIKDKYDYCHTLDLPNNVISFYKETMHHQTKKMKVCLLYLKWITRVWMSQECVLMGIGKN